MTLQKQINKLNNDFKDKKGFKDISMSDADIQAIKNSQNKQEIDTNINKAIENIIKQIPKTAGQRIKEWRYLAMLGNPKIHIRNMVSNIAMKGVSKVKNFQAKLLEDIINPKERTKTLKKPSQKTIDFVNQDVLEQKSRIQGTDKYDTGKIKLQAKQNKISQFNSKLLENEDLIFSSKAYKNALADYITANNIDTDTSNIIELENARQYAIEEAQYQTFRQFSQFAEAIGNLENKNIATKLAVGAVVPFKTTPINIAKAGIEYSPVGLAKTITKNTIDLKNGKITGAKYIDNLTKGMTGTMIMGLGMLLSNMGILTASGSEEDKEKYYEQALGIQPYSVQIGNKSYSLSWLSPAAIPFFIGAEISEMKKEGVSDGKVSQIFDSMSTMLDPLTEMSLLQGLNTTLSSYEQNKVGGVLFNMGQNYAGQFIPTISGQIARTVDTKRRDTTGQGKGTTKQLDRFINKQIAKIPFASKTLQPYTNQFGKEEKTGGIAERIFQNFVSPGYLKDINITKTDKELLDLYKKTGATEVLPKTASRNFTENKEVINLTPKEYTKFNKDRGEATLKYLNDFVNKDYYKGLSDEEKIASISSIYRYGQQVAKYNYLQNKKK